MLGVMAGSKISMQIVEQVRRVDANHGDHRRVGGDVADAQPDLRAQGGVGQDLPFDENIGVLFELFEEIADARPVIDHDRGGRQGEKFGI